MKQNSLKDLLKTFQMPDMPRKEKEYLYTSHTLSLLIVKNLRKNSILKLIRKLG